MSVCFGVGCETLCRGCFEFLGCGVGYGVDFCLYASVLDVKRCADCCDGTVTRFSTCGARLRGYSCFRLPHFGSVLNCRYRSIQAQVSFFQLSTIAALYKKGPGVCRGAVALRPLCGFPQLPKAKKPGLLPSKKVKIKPKTNHTINKEKENHKEK